MSWYGINSNWEIKIIIVSELKTKYEVRSHEVQEVMNKPPHFIVNWGNTLIVLIIAAALILMNRIQLQTKEQLLAAFVSRRSQHDSQLLLFSLNITPQHSLQRGNQASVTILGNNAVSAGSLAATIDSLWTAGNATLLSLKVAGSGEDLRLRNNRLLHPSEGMQVSIDVTTAKEKVFVSMFRKLIKR